MKGIYKENESLAPLTSWHIGGPADIYYRPQNIDDLSQFLKAIHAKQDLSTANKTETLSLPDFSNDDPITWLGLGSNVLINDAGIRGLVIHMLANDGNLNVVETKTDSKIIRAEAGITCAKVAKFCAKEGLEGGEFFAGIPGTVGGALAMNAGAFGGETWPRVVQVEVIDRFGEMVKRLPSDYKIAYRSVQRLIEPTKQEWFTAGYFEIPCGDGKASAQRIKELLRDRNASQPIGVFSCGSVFKNPEGNFAGRLIEASNLKGFSIGGAQISPKHANFILNLGSASAQDILQLIQHIQATVLKEHQVLLQTEVRTLGF